MGIDGRIYPVGAMPAAQKGKLDFMDDWYPVQVKQKDKVGRPDIDAFGSAMQRSHRKIGFFVAFDYTHDARRQIAAFFRRTGLIIRAITVQDILDEQLALKIA